jgi:hypothetical protein
MRYFLPILLFCFIASANALMAQSFSADAFLPPAQATTPAKEAELRKVADPGAVVEAPGPVTEKPAVKANSAQDAINAFVDRRTSGVTELLFPSGYGFAATGTAVYQIHESDVTTRIDKRNAYVKAYAEARKELTQALNGISNNGKEKLAESSTTIDTSSERTLTNDVTSTTEDINQVVNGLLRGYVVYDVYDDINENQVFVTIVTTPKTQGRYERPDSSSVIASSVAEGLNEVIAEASNGLVPPVGGRIIFVPATAEVAFVGFGSSVVRRDKDKALQAKHNLRAERIAKIRATDSLSGIINSDRITATENLDEETKELIKDYDEITKNDPIYQPNTDSKNYKVLAERKKEFVNSQSLSSVITSIRKGTIPPGVKVEGWRDDNNEYAYAMAVYLPSASARAEDAGAKMRESVINQSSSSTHQSQSLEKEPIDLAPINDTPVTQGPSGRVHDENDL